MHDYSPPILVGKYKLTSVSPVFGDIATLKNGQISLSDHGL